MKTRLLIIIGLIIAIIISVSALIIIDNIEPRNQQAIADTPFSPHTGLGILHALSVADKEKLQKVLDDCASSVEPEFGLVYSNDTHYIGNRDCMWEPRNSLSDRTRSDYDPNIPYELQKILDDCDTESMGLDMSRELTNGTHSINNNSCEWKLVEKDPNPTQLGGPIIVDDFTSDDETLRDKYKDLPEVMAFYAKYPNAQASVREDHISYFAGSDDDALMRMNIFFDENQTITEIDTHCYFQKVHQYEIPQEDIVYRLEKYDCKK